MRHLLRGVSRVFSRGLPGPRAGNLNDFLFRSLAPCRCHGIARHRCFIWCNNTHMSVFVQHRIYCSLILFFGLGSIHVFTAHCLSSSYKLLYDELNAHAINFVNADIHIMTSMLPGPCVGGSLRIHACIKLFHACLKSVV